MTQPPKEPTSHGLVQDLVEVTVVATPQMQAEDRYVKVPFEVLPGTQSIGVRVDFDKEAGVIDLGCEGPNGWRGWSGGARDEFTISASDATPGYIPGPLEPGQWHVILGLHILRKPEVPVKVQISMPSQVELPGTVESPPVVDARRGSSRNLPAPDGYTWFAGDFHSHTVHSDGSLTVDQLAALAVEMGLDFLAVTDHNTVSHHKLLEEAGKRYGITLIPGQEVTSHRGHANAYGDIGWIDFRQPASTWLDQVHEAGGILSLNHPIDADCGWLEPMPVPPDAIELWHASWYRDLYQDGILAWYARGDRGVPLIGGSDFHRLESEPRPGTPVTWVLAKDSSVDSILEAVKAGRTTITGAGTFDGRVLEPIVFDCPIMLRNEPDQLLVLGGQGFFLVDLYGRRRFVESQQETFTAPVEDGPYMLLMPDRMIVALTA